MEKLESANAGGIGGSGEGGNSSFPSQHLGVMRVAKTKNYNPAEI